MVDLYRREIGSVIIEGGSQTLNSFIQLDLWDETRVFTSPRQFKEGIDAPRIGVAPTNLEEVEGDKLTYYFNTKTTDNWQKN